MAECQTAVPAWIMTVNKAMESLDPSATFLMLLLLTRQVNLYFGTWHRVYGKKRLLLWG
jgi:hypothetical protein